MVTYRFAYWSIVGIFILCNHLDAGPKRKSAEISNNQDGKSLESLDSLIVQSVDHKKLETLIEQNLFFKKVLLEQGCAIVDLKSSLEVKNQELATKLSRVLATCQQLQTANIGLQQSNTDLKKACARFKLDISCLKKRINDDKAERLALEGKVDEMSRLVIKTRKTTATALHSVEKLLNQEKKTLMPHPAAQKGFQSVYEKLPSDFCLASEPESLEDFNLSESIPPSADQNLPRVLSNSSICTNNSDSWRALTGNEPEATIDFAGLFPSSR